jgi:hypothetical protein
MLLVLLLLTGQLHRLPLLFCLQVRQVWLLLLSGLSGVCSSRPPAQHVLLRLHAAVAAAAAAVFAAHLARGCDRQQLRCIAQCCWLLQRWPWQLLLTLAGHSTWHQTGVNQLQQWWITACVAVRADTAHTLASDAVQASNRLVDAPCSACSQACCVLAAPSPTSHRTTRL